MAPTSKVKKLQTLLNQVLRRLLGVGRYAPGIALAPIMRELGLAPIEAIAAASRTRAFLKASSLHTYISMLVAQPSTLRPNTWTSGTVRWLDRHARHAGERPSEVLLPQDWRTMPSADAGTLVKAFVWARFESSDSVASTNGWREYAQAAYAKNTLPQFGTGIPSGVVPGLHVMIQMRTRAFPTARRLARVQALPERYLDYCPACCLNVPESVPHLLAECRRWEAHRHSLRAAAPELSQLIARVSSCPEDTAALLLGGTPPPLHDDPDFSENGRFVQLWRQALPCVALFVLHVTHSRFVTLREMGLAPSRIIRTGRRPNG